MGLSSQLFHRLRGGGLSGDGAGPGRRRAPLHVYFLRGMWVVNPQLAAAAAVLLLLQGCLFFAGCAAGWD